MCENNPIFGWGHFSNENPIDLASTQLVTRPFRSFAIAGSQAIV